MILKTLFVKIERSDDHNCNGGSQLIDISIFGGVPPYRIDASSLPLISGGSSSFEITKTVNEEGVANEIISAPVGKINVKITEHLWECCSRSTNDL